MHTEDARIAFVLSQTAREPVPLVPEVSIYAASQVTPLWSATQHSLDLSQLEPPFWAFAWPGGQALARHLLDHPTLVQGRRVLDFASGSGLVGIAASLAGAARVLLADIDALALTAARLNAREHGGIECTADDLVGTDIAEIEVVLAGDVFYDRRDAERFDRWFRQLARRGVCVLVGDPKRAYLPADLVELARYEVPVAFDLESSHSKTTAVYSYPPHQGNVSS